MATLKRKNANGQWELLQVTGDDVRGIKNKVDEVSAELAQTEQHIERLDVDKANKSEVEGTNTRIDNLVLESGGDSNIEVADGRASVTKNKTFGVIGSRIEEIEKDTFSPIQNIVSNGNFASTSGWQALNSTILASNNTLSMTSDGTSAMPSIRRQYGTRNGRRYYAKALFRYVGTKTPNFRIRVGGLSLVSKVKENDNYHELSGVGTISNDGAANFLQLDAIFDTSENANGEKIELQYFLVVDLTSQFGAGFEPTKEEMDSLISNFENKWFSGVSNLVFPKANIDVQRAKTDKVANIVYESIDKRFENIEKNITVNKGIITEQRTTTVDEQSDRIAYSGSWSLVERSNTTITGHSRVTNVAGRTATFKFYGDYIALWLERSYIGGIADIYIDGVKVAEVDTYTPQNPGFTFPAAEKNLPYGEHELKVVVTGNKNPESGNSYIYLDCILYREEVKSITNKFQSGIILTFDDSRSYIYSSAPVMAERGLKATCYVNPDIFDKTTSQNTRMNYNIQALKRYDWEITSHLYKHDSLTGMTLEEAENQIVQSLQWLKSRGLDYAHFAAPYGHLNSEVTKLIKKYHSTSVLVGLEPVAFNPKNFDPYAIPRMQIQQDTNLTTLSNFLDDVKKKNLTTVLCLHGVADGAVNPNMTYEKFNDFLDIIQSKDMPIMRMKDFFGE